MEDEEAMEDDEGRPTLEISFDGLEPLGDDFEYEVWTVVDGEAITGGIFDIAEDGSIEFADGDTFYGHEGASDVVISIEPAADDDPAPADTKILGGAIAEDGTFELAIDHPAALGTDFSDAGGYFILGTPTNDPDPDENSGVWFISLPGPEQGLELTELPAGWVYEGWAVIDGVPVTTGTFFDPGAADDFNGFSGDGDAPPFPGEDFIVNAPEGLTFPTDLSSSTIVVSVEPYPDNSEAPFTLKPLVTELDGTVTDHENIALGQGFVAITGSGSVVEG